MERTDLEQRVLRIKASHDVENLICRYSYYLTAGEWKTMSDMFAHNTDDISVSVASLGTWKGREGLKRYHGFLDNLRGDKAGQLEIHLATNMMVEVSQDALTAKAVLVSPGVATGEREGEILSAGWDWAKAELELICEDGYWKFRNIKLFELIYAPYGHTFVGCSRPVPICPKQFAPDEVFECDCSYQPEGVQRLLPVLPQKY
jgi:hypothetical protein